MGDHKSGRQLTVSGRTLWVVSDEPEIRIDAFDERRPRRAWVVDGLQVAVYHGFYGALNGYVRLPAMHPDLLKAVAAENVMPPVPFIYPDGVTLGVNYPHGYDYIDVDCPGGWTYGPDEEGWIGFDTGHAWDHWSAEDRRRFCETDRERKATEMMIALEEEMAHFGRLPGDRLWTEEKLMEATEEVAKQLAARLVKALRKEVRNGAEH